MQERDEIPQHRLTNPRRRREDGVDLLRTGTTRVRAQYHALRQSWLLFSWLARGRSSQTLCLLPSTGHSETSSPFMRRNSGGSAGVGHVVQIAPASGHVIRGQTRQAGRIENVTT